MYSRMTTGSASVGRRGAALLAVLGVLTLATASPTIAQMGAGISTGAKLDLTHVSAEARTAFLGGVTDLANVFPARGITRLQEALTIGETFGLARVFWATAAPLSTEARTAELDRGVVDAAKGSVAEATFAMAIRAQRLNRPDEARSLFRTARQLLPGDPYVAYYATIGSFGPTTTAADRLIALRRLTERFPDLAPAYNNLGYTLHANGDRTGGLAAVRKYAELAPNHPNAKDSYAEILQWEGRFDEAIVLYREAAAIDPTYVAAYTGIAEVRQLQGRGGDARAALMEGVGQAPTPAGKANLQRLIALSFALDGNRKGAEEALGTAMTTATPANLPALISGIHRDFARVNAMTGNPKGVAPHLQATTNPNPAVNVADAMLLASVGMNAEARAKLDAANADPAAGQNAYVTGHAPIVRAMILVNEGSAESALTEIATGDVTIPLAQAVTALAEQQRKNTTTARLMRDRVLSDPFFVAGNRELSLAHMLASRVK